MIGITTAIQLFMMFGSPFTDVIEDIRAVQIDAGVVRVAADEIKLSLG